MKKPTTKNDEKRTRIDRVKVTRMMCGQSCGPYGTPCYQIVGRDEHPSVGGVNLERIIGFPLHEGAVVEVGVRLVKQGKPLRNPWHDGKAGNPPKPKPLKVPKWQR